MLVTLEAAPTGIDVQVGGSYPFEIWDGNNRISARSARHDITVEPPKTLRLVAPDVLLNAPLRVERSAKRARERIGARAGQAVAVDDVRDVQGRDRRTGLRLSAPVRAAAGAWHL